MSMMGQKLNRQWIAIRGTLNPKRTTFTPSAEGSRGPTLFIRRTVGSSQGIEMSRGENKPDNPNRKCNRFVGVRVLHIVECFPQRIINSPETINISKIDYSVFTDKLKSLVTLNIICPFYGTVEKWRVNKNNQSVSSVIYIARIIQYMLTKKYTVPYKHCTSQFFCYIYITFESFTRRF